MAVSSFDFLDYETGYKARFFRAGQLSLALAGIGLIGAGFLFQPLDVDAATKTVTTPVKTTTTTTTKTTTAAKTTTTTKTPLPPKMVKTTATKTTTATTTQLKAATMQASSYVDLSQIPTAHPRLYANAAVFEQVKARMDNDTRMKAWYQQMDRDARSILPRGPVTYKITGGRLLDQSREAYRRITLLAGLYRLDQNKAYAERAKLELLAISSFPDWHPAHFLDTAEMMNAAAIGYDWLYDYLSPDERQVVAGAIYQKGIQAALGQFADSKVGWWTTVNNNWNFVCNGGAAAASLAVADLFPVESSILLEKTLSSVQIPMLQFSPDGGWDESAMYWNYATRYLVFYLAALNSVLNTDYGLSSFTGLKDTGFFNVYLTSPTQLNFNFGDGHPEPDPASQTFWLASKFNQPVFQQIELNRLNYDLQKRPDIFHLLWFNPTLSEPNYPAIPRARAFKRVNVASYRSHWTDPAALYIGFKGGDNAASHSHLDLGSFVFDSDGVRWASDLGSGNYNDPGYFGTLRSSNAAVMTQSHNTLTINDENQVSNAKAPITNFYFSDGIMKATVDLTQAYAPKVQSAQRFFNIFPDKSAEITDQIQWGGAPGKLQWNLHTTTEVTVNGNIATLSGNSKTRTLKITSPQGATFSLAPATLPVTVNRQQQTLKRLMIDLPQQSGTTTLTVTISPSAVLKTAQDIYP